MTLPCDKYTRIIKHNAEISQLVVVQWTWKSGAICRVKTLFGHQCGAICVVSYEDYRTTLRIIGYSGRYTYITAAVAVVYTLEERYITVSHVSSPLLLLLSDTGTSKKY